VKDLALQKTGTACLLQFRLVLSIPLSCKTFSYFDYIIVPKDVIFTVTKYVDFIFRWYNYPMKISEKSKLYLWGFWILILTLFVIVAIVFWSIVHNYGNQSPQETYSYFLMLVDRWLFFLIVFGFLPLTVFQWTTKDKTTGDWFVGVFSGIMLCLVFLVFFSGESYFMQKYNEGELSSSNMFCKSTIETRVFDTILRFQGSTPPVMCVPSDFSKKIK